MVGLEHHYSLAKNEMQCKITLALLVASLVVHGEDYKNAYQPMIVLTCMAADVNSCNV